MRRGLIAARKARRLTQRELATIINVDRTAVTKYETGVIDIPGRILTRLAAFFDCPMEELYTNEVTPDLRVEDALTHA